MAWWWSINVISRLVTMILLVIQVLVIMRLIITIEPIDPASVGRLLCLRHFTTLSKGLKSFLNASFV